MEKPCLFSPDFCLTFSLRKFNVAEKNETNRKTPEETGIRNRKGVPPRSGLLRSIVRQDGLIPADGFDSSPTPHEGESLSSAGVHEAL